MWCCIYKSYGEWRVTSLFDTEKAARKHAAMYLLVEEKDYITEVKFRFIDVEAP